MTMVEIGAGSESTAIESDGGRGDVSLGDRPPTLNDETDTWKTDTPVAPSNQTTVASRRKNAVKEVIASTPIMSYETPIRRHRTPSNFVFLSDRKSVPTEIKNLQERTIKRRRDFVARMHDLVGGWKNMACDFSD